MNQQREKNATMLALCALSLGEFKNETAGTLVCSALTDHLTEVNYEN
jgi:hypothetical protein